MLASKRDRWCWSAGSVVAGALLLCACQAVLNPQPDDPGASTVDKSPSPAQHAGAGGAHGTGGSSGTFTGSLPPPVGSNFSDAGLMTGRTSDASRPPDAGVEAGSVESKDAAPYRDAHATGFRD